jgi:outer membrane receptor protein involved in Fe transport
MAAQLSALDTMLPSCLTASSAGKSQSHAALIDPFDEPLVTPLRVVLRASSYFGTGNNRTTSMNHLKTRSPRPRGVSIATTVLSAVFVCMTSEGALSQTTTPASQTQTRAYTIGAQALGAALQQFAAQAGIQLLFSESDVAGMQTGGLQGSFTRNQALESLLTGSGLVFEFLKPDAAIIRRPGNSRESGSTGSGADGSGVLAASQGGGGGSQTVAAVSSEDNSSSSPGPASQSAADIKEVIVTGRAGTEQRTKAETSYSVTTIDEKKLRLQGPTSVTESLKSVPGFWVEASGGEASGNVRARGIPVDGFGSITLLEDGMPVQHDPSLGYLNGDQAFRLDETIDRIEVVRGGPSSIFYSNAPAGAVNYIPRRVGDTPEGVLKYTVGDYGLNRVDVWYGAPIAADWKIGMGGFYRYDNGVRDPGFHGDNGGQFRISLDHDFERGKISFDVKRLDDSVYLDLGIPMYTAANGKLHAVPGFDGNFGTIAGPETASARMVTGDGSDFLFDNTVGTQVRRTQLTMNLQFEVADGYIFDDHVRYDDTDTLRNGVYPNQLLTASAFLAQSAASLANYPGATALQLRYTDSPGTVFNNANQNGNGLITIGGLRSVTSPFKEFMNDARLMHKFQLGDQTHDATLGFYVANITNNFDRYSSDALLDVQDNSRLLDLVAVNAAGNVVGTLTDQGIYRDGYEWANATGQSTTSAFYLSDEWQITHSLRMDAGVRWEQVHLTANVEEEETVNLGTPATSQILTGSGQFKNFEQTFSKVGWTVGENWQFSDHSGLFARYTPTFRLPSISSYVTATLPTTNPTLTQPVTQTMDLAELGYKFANQWTDLYATAFWTKYNNVQFTNYVFNIATNEPPVSDPSNANTKTYGLELEGGFYPVEWFDLTFNSTLEQPKYSGLVYTDNVNGTPTARNYNGDQLIRVPKVSVRIVPGLNLFNQRLRLQAAWEWEGNRYVDIANSVVLPHYDVLNASARFSVTNHFDVYAYVDNVTNSLGLTEGNPRAGELQSQDVGATSFIARPLLGRSFRLALMYRL